MKVNGQIRFTERDKQRGFTLLEVLLATLIFSIVVTAVYMSFRIGTKAYQASEEKNRLLQEARFCFHLIQRDLNSVYYIPESDYNQNIRRHLEQIEQLREEAEELGIPVDEYIREQLKKGELNKKDTQDIDDEDENPFDPYNWGIPIDLKFIGINSGETDSFEFVRYQNDDGTMIRSPWSLERVKYSVRDNMLVRESKPIFLPPKDKEGNPIPTPESPVEIVAEGVEKFDVSYGYFFDGEWLEAEDWNSEERKYRNPLPELDPDDPEYLQKIREEMNKPIDGLPGYVFINLELIEPERGARRMTFKTLINIPSAQENNIPSKDEEEED